MSQLASCSNICHKQSFSFAPTGSSYTVYLYVYRVFFKNSLLSLIDRAKTDDRLFVHKYLNIWCNSMKMLISFLSFQSHD